MSFFNWFKPVQPAPVHVQPKTPVKRARAEQRMARIELAIQQGQGTPALQMELAKLRGEL